MGKSVNRAELLRGRASRVEKARRVQKGHRSLPSWYRRVQFISLKENREVNGYDFDEDLSELEERKGHEANDIERFESGYCKDCECGDENFGCDCEHENGDDVDEEDESERSYDGSDADYYYELKEEREARKREKLWERKEKERQRDIERAKEEEGRVAYRFLDETEREGKIIPVGLLARQSSKLFCSDHIDHFFSDLYATKRVDFYHLDDIDISYQRKLKPGSDTDMLYGDEYLDANANCNFGPFCPPKRGSRKAFKIRSCDGLCELSFKCIGNGHLNLRVSREMAFMSPDSGSRSAPPEAALEAFEFVGIWRDREKEKAERQERMTKARRPPSPQETWFEMNHLLVDLDEYQRRTASTSFPTRRSLVSCSLELQSRLPQ